MPSRDAGSSANDTLKPAIKHIQAGRLDLAEAQLRRICGKPGADEQGLLMLAQVLIDQQKTEQAAFELERAIRARPQSAPPRLMMGKAWMAAGRYDRALRVLEEGVGVCPDDADLCTSSGVVCLQLGRMAEAETWFRRALDLRAGDAAATVWLAQTLSGSLRTDQAVEMLREDVRARPGRASVQQTLVFLLMYLDGAQPEEVFREHRLAGLLTARSAGGVPPRVLVDADPERRLAIGYISPDFRQHSCAYFIEPLLAHHERARVRTIAYSSTSGRDAVTRRLRALVDEWRDVRPMSDEALAAQIAADRVDIAVDLAGHSASNRLATLAYRPAPIAMTYMGYPNTTGMPGIDYRLVDARTDPPGSDSLATESLLRLVECFLCYQPPADAPPVAVPPGAARGQTTFGSFNALDKVSPSTTAAWAAILAAKPDSRLVLKSSKLGDVSVRERLLARFETHGVGRARIECLPWTGSIREHLECYGNVDIALDPFPYNGTTTTCESLYMGVPVVALAGAAHAGRVGCSLLSSVGHPELVATSVEHYVRLAVDLASDPERLAALRRGLRSAVTTSALCDGPGHARRVEAEYRRAWRAWCDSRNSQR